MSETCPECGAEVAVGGSCRDHFDALLALEWGLSVSPEAGKRAHFFAVSSFGLQHPDSMRYTAQSLDWLRASVRSMLVGATDVVELRRQAGGRASGGRVTRREGDPAPGWDVAPWSMTVSDVLAGGAEGYCERVERWAASIIADLDHAGA